MSDLGKTNAEWLQALDGLGLFLQLLREERERERRASLERVQARNHNDFNGNFEVPHDGNTLSGVTIGEDTTEAGEIPVVLDTQIADRSEPE